MSRTVPPLPGCRNCDQYTRTGLEEKRNSSSFTSCEFWSKS